MQPQAVTADAGRSHHPPNGEGEVKNFARVTDDMLRNPAQGDWPVRRRDDQYASSYSPLVPSPPTTRRISAAVDLPMNEGGTETATSPLAYNGTVFLTIRAGSVQAIDGKTGDLIWEQRLGVNIAMRGMTLYNDKLYLA